MASAMTSATIGSVTLAVAAVVFLSQNSAMRSSTLGGVTSSVPSATLSRTGMVSRTVGQVTASTPDVQMRVPMRSQTLGSVTLTSTPTALIALRLNPVTATITGSVTRALMRRRVYAGLTVFDAAREVYNLWNIEIVDPRKITFARERVLQYINQTMQLIYSRAHLLDFFSLKEFPITMPAATNNVAMSDEILVVRGPVKLVSTKAPLRKLASLGELEQYVANWLGETPAGGIPQAYYVDSRNQSGSDSVLLTLYVVPTPADETEVSVEAVMQPPRYDASDLLLATGLELPHKHAESLMWPILRYHAVADSNYTGTAEQRADVVAKYEQAMALLGLITPAPKELGGAKQSA